MSLRQGLTALALMFGAANANGATVYTGNKIQGVTVINQLDVGDLDGIGSCSRSQLQNYLERLS